MRGTLLTSPSRSSPLDGRLAGWADRLAVERALWIVVLASVALDIYTTWLGLTMGLAEGNPVMRWAIDDVGFVALGGAKCLAVGVAACLRRVRPRHGTAIALGLALPWTVTVLVNAVVLATA